MRPGAWVPFPQAPPLLAHFTRTTVSEPTLRRKTEQAGAASVAMQTSAVEALERAAPGPPPGPPRQQVSVDGALVPLVGTGRCAEVKTLASGSDFSRFADHETFTRLALVGTHCRGVTTAGRGAGVTDGARWAQQCLE